MQGMLKDEGVGRNILGDCKLFTVGKVLRTVKQDGVALLMTDPPCANYTTFHSPHSIQDT